MWDNIFFMSYERMDRLAVFPNHYSNTPSSILQPQPSPHIAINRRPGESGRVGKSLCAQMLLVVMGALLTFLWFPMEKGDTYPLGRSGKGGEAG